MRVFGHTAIQEFSAKHAAARKPLARFLLIVSQSAWSNFPQLRETFPATDYAPSTGTLIFNIGGKKYRLIARVDFDEQMLFVQSVLTHEQHNRERL